jgi:hypothetical protein
MDEMTMTRMYECGGTKMIECIAKSLLVHACTILFHVYEAPLIERHSLLELVVGRRAGPAAEEPWSFLLQKVWSLAFCVAQEASLSFQEGF